MSEKFEIEVASIPSQENLVSEIFYNGVQWAQIIQESGGLVIQFYSNPKSEYWEFPLELAIEALENAKKKLLKMV